MTTHRTLSWAIPGTPAGILQRLRDPEVARRRAQSEPSLPAHVTELSAGPAPDIALVYEVTAQLPDSWIPAPAVAHLRTRPGITRRETWRLGADGDAQAQVDFTLDAIPATRLRGAAGLRARDEQECELRYDLSLDVTVPLLGRGIEAALIAKISTAFEREAAVIAST